MKFLNFKILKEEVPNCDYIKKCKTNKKCNNTNSLSNLIDIKLSQSECIKMGNALEKYLAQIIEKYTNFSNIKEKNKKGKKEKDHLFINEKEKIIVYAEIKSNLDLDTEKAPATVSKCLEIVEELKEKYTDYEIKWCLLGTRYYNKKEIPKNIIKKYKSIQDNLFGVNDYFELYNIKFKFTVRTYKGLINFIAKTAFG